MTTTKTYGGTSIVSCSGHEGVGRRRFLRCLPFKGFILGRMNLRKLFEYDGPSQPFTSRQTCIGIINLDMRRSISKLPRVSLTYSRELLLPLLYLSPSLELSKTGSPGKGQVIRG